MVCEGFFGRDLKKIQFWCEKTQYASEVTNEGLKKKIDKKKILQRGMVNTYKRVGAIEY